MSADAEQHNCCCLQDIFVGAWQQADPAIDQVPFTFPPAHGPTNTGRCKSTQRAFLGAFKNKGSRQNGQQFAASRGHGRGFNPREAKLQPRAAKPPKGIKQPKGGVSAAEYAKALEDGL